MEWKPIETAPKEQDVLVYIGKGMPPRVAGDFDGWYTFERPDSEIFPTHWLPLPESPEE